MSLPPLTKRQAAIIAKRTCMRSNRAEYDRVVAETEAQMKAHGTVEILTGPCEGIVVKDEASLRQYKLKLWAWLTEPLRAYGTGQSFGI